MKVNVCEFCQQHEVHIDVLDNEFYHDGCVCKLNTPESNHMHGQNCTEYVDPQFRTGCPYFKLRE